MSKTTTRLALVLLAGLALGTPNARAATLAGATLPDTYTVDGQVLRLNGIGLRSMTILNVHIYVAALYTAVPAHDARTIETAASPKVLLLQYIHGGSKEQVEEEYRKGEALNCGHGECAKADEPDFNRLIAVAPAVKFGDTTTYIATSKGLRVLANDKPLIEIANPDLGIRVIDGFIGAHPPMESLRASLLGNPS